MISIENKFIFTHIGRTGGASIEIALSDYGFKKPHKSYLLNHDPKLIYFEASQHWTSREEKVILGDKVWSECFKFTIVRNPWDRVVSQYCGHVVKEVPELSFDEYIIRSFEEKVYHDDPRFVMPCMDWITDSHDNIMVDFIGHTETLQKSFDEICEILGAPQHTLAKHGESDRQDHYRKYYNDKTAELVADVFEKDIKQFNYEF
jgi:hypothetical protein